MKEVIYPSAETSTIPFEEVKKKDYPLLGFLHENGDKVFLISTDFCTELYFARCLKYFEKGNGYNPGKNNAHTIQEWCEFFTKNYNSRIFLFDTPKELFAWLAE